MILPTYLVYGEEYEKLVEIVEEEEEKSLFMAVHKEV